MATFGIEEANQLARQRTPSAAAAFISRGAKRGPLAAAVARQTIVTAPLSATPVAPVAEPEPVTQDERDDASARNLRALAASVGVKGFVQQPTMPPSGASGNGDDDAADLLRLAAAIGLSGFGGRG